MARLIQFRSLEQWGSERKNGIMTEMVPVVAAAGYSMAYLLGGGGLVGALVIFVVAKMFGK